MADYTAAISLSQAHSSSDDDSDQNSPRNIPTFSITPASGGGGSISPSSKPRVKTTKIKTNNKMISIIDQHCQIIHSPGPETTSSGGGSRKPRGRPPGSKNKPKPPVVITRDSESAMKPVILEISAGGDVIENIITFARRNNLGVSIMSVSGSVSCVTLRHPISHTSSLTLHGPFNLLSLSGTFYSANGGGGVNSGGSSNSLTTSSTAPNSCTFGVTLAGTQGQVFGGIIGGKMTAASQVVVVAATYSSPSFHRLPVLEERQDHHEERQDHHQDMKPSYGSGGGASESCSSMGMSMAAVYGGGSGSGSISPSPLSCQISPDVVHWGPPSRPPY